jgi:hypothetical protein
MLFKSATFETYSLWPSLDLELSLELHRPMPAKRFVTFSDI